MFTSDEDVATVTPLSIVIEDGPGLETTRFTEPGDVVSTLAGLLSKLGAPMLFSGRLLPELGTVLLFDAVPNVGAKPSRPPVPTQSVAAQPKLFFKRAK